MIASGSTNPTKARMHITLPIPPIQLSPNWRGHHMARANQVAWYRELASIEARCWCHENRRSCRSMPWRTAVAQATFWLPDRRRRDADNLLAMLKPAFDGLRDAGVLLDDDELVHLPVSKRLDRQEPRVELRLVRLGQEAQKMLDRMVEVLS